MYNTYPFLRHTFLGQTCAYYTQDCTDEAMCDGIIAVMPQMYVCEN